MSESTITTTTNTSSNIMVNYNSDNLLNFIENYDTLDSERFAELHEYMQKIGKLKEVCDLNTIKVRPDDGRHYIYIKRQQIIGKNKKDLISKLYDHFFHLTLEGILPEWLLWRRDKSNVSNKTLIENLYLWNAYFKDTELVKMQITKLKASDFISLFRIMLQNNDITRKRFNDSKSVLNSLYNYCIEMDIVTHNPIKEINCSKMFKFKPENFKVDVFTLDERESLLDYLSAINDIYSLGVQLDFHLICRIGELLALRWTDIKGDFITIHSQRLDDQTMNDDLTFNPRTYKNVDHIKGNTKYGYRRMPLTKSAKKILERIKEINPHGEFILMTDNHQLNHTTFNRHLKGYCTAIGIEPRTSHKIRFTVASILYKQGMQATTLQRLLGHSTLAMTLHYLRELDSEDDLHNAYCDILD